MNYKLRTTNPRGFSLTEVLLAVGTLAVGMLFIAGTFLVGIHFSTIATEQTIAAVTADEAFAKIKIYGVNLSSLSTNQQTPFETVVLNPINPDEFAYPSTNTVSEKQYYWSALCRRAGPAPEQLVQVTVFVCRKVGAGTKYRNPADPCNPAVAIDYPMPVRVGVSGAVGSNVLNIENIENISWINNGYTIVDNGTGGIYRVLERYADDPTTPPSVREDRIILLDRRWAGGPPGSVWVVPPPVGSGRNPCIVVYPTEIRF